MTRISKQPDVRKQELLDIGISRYFEVGEKGISIQQIVQTAHVATGLFYYYFQSKEDFLDQALNHYVEKEMERFFKTLHDDTLDTQKKLDAMLDDYVTYARRMAPYRSAKAFQSQRHFQLTERLIMKMQPLVVQILKQGCLEGCFHIQDIELTSGFMLNGLSCLFDSTMEIKANTTDEMKKIVYSLLGVTV